MKYKSRKKQWKCLLVAVIMLLQAVMGITVKPVSVSAGANVDPFQILLIEAMALDFDDRVDLTDYLSLNIETAEDINAETIAGVKQWVPALSDSEMEDALKIYANRSEDGKFYIIVLIQKGLKKINEDLSGFQGICSIFNESIAGDPSDMRGFRFFMTVMFEARNFIGKTLATDGTPVNKIKFQLDGYESEKARISGFLGLLTSLKNTISSYPGTNNFEKLLSFSEQSVNSRPNEEIRAFKVFLGSEDYKIYEGDPFKEPSPDPSTGGGGGAGGGGAVNPPVESDKVKEHIEKLQKITSELEKASDSQKADMIAALAEELGNCFSVTAEAVESKQQMLELIVKALKSINTAVKSTVDESNLSKINDAVVSIINSASPINNEDGQKTVVPELKKLILSIIEKTGTIDGLIITNESEHQQLDAKMDKVIALISRLQQAVAKSGLNISLENKIYINLSAAEGKYSIKLNKDIVTKALGKGIKKVEFVSEIGRAAVTLDSMMDLQQLKTIELNATEALITQQEFDSLTPAQKEIVKPNSKVLEFKANVAITMGLVIEVNDFIMPIVIHIPYELKAGETGDTITVFYLGDDGTVSNMSARYDEEEKELIFNTTRLGRFAVKNNIVTFNDVKEGHWGKKWIEAMASKGIVNGKSKDIFDPEGKVTRAEFAKMITMTLGLVDSSARSDFKDVKSSDWYAIYVASAYKAGIITGRPDGTFAPNENISRQDMAVMLARALKQEAPADVDKYINFADKKKIADYARQSLAIAVKNGLITGKPGNIVDPEGNATRAEAATIIYRLFNN